MVKNLDVSSSKMMMQQHHSVKAQHTKAALAAAATCALRNVRHASGLFAVNATLLMRPEEINILAPSADNNATAIGYASEVRIQMKPTASAGHTLRAGRGG